jgi:hypothetical protein
MEFVKQILLRCGMDSAGSGQGPFAGFFEHGDGLPGSIKAVNFLKTWVLSFRGTCCIIQLC